MPPTPQTNIRIAQNIKDAAIAAAKEQGVSLSRLVELAIERYLGTDTVDTAPDTAPDTALEARLASLEARLASLERPAAAPPLACRAVGPPPHDRSAPPTPQNEGLSQGEALAQAGFPGSLANAATWCRRHGWESPATWLEAQGWGHNGGTGRGRVWFPPPKS